MRVQRTIKQQIIILVLVVGVIQTSFNQVVYPSRNVPPPNLSGDLKSQSSSTLLSTFDQTRFERISPSDGLSHPNVLGIMQDHLGFMWFATTNGLNMYDGYTFSVYRNKPGDRTTLDFDDLEVIFEDSDNILWVGGAGGVDRLDRTSEKFSRLDEYGQVFSILESQDGILWAGFWHGLYGYNRDSGEILYSYPSKLNDRLDPDENLQGFIRAIDEDSQGNLWLGTEYGLYYFDRETNQFTRFAHDPENPASLIHDRVYTVFVDSQERVWAGTQGGLDRLSKERGDFIHYAFDPGVTDNINTDTITSILEDESGSLWVGTDHGLVYLDPIQNQYYRFLHNPDSHSTLSDNVVYSLFEDRTGLIWIGTRNGISLYNPRANIFQINHHPQDLTHFKLTQSDNTPQKPFSEMGIEALLEDQQGNMWLGTRNGGLFWVNSDSGEIRTYQTDPAEQDDLPGNHISAIYQDHGGTIWVGTGNGWLEQYDPTTDELIPVEKFTARIVSLNQDQDGNLWIGTHTRGIASLEPNQGTLTIYKYVDPAQFAGSDVFSSHIITSIFVDHQGRPWVGTYLGGINVWLGDEIIHYEHNPDNQNSLSHNFVMSFYEENEEDKHIMWVGTMGGGLNRFDMVSEKWTHYTTEDGLADDIITCILGDASGNLWMSTPKGLTKFDPEQETFWNLTESDGVPGGSVLPGACLSRTDLTMAFTTPNSIITFDPAQVSVNPGIPPLVITTLEVNGQAIHKNIPSDLEVRLSYDENNLVIKFAVLDYASPEKNSFAYRMVGVDKNWINAGTLHQVNYLDLNPGTYTFNLRGSNSNGIWNENGLALQLSIAPPFWKTAWFLGLAGLLLLAGAYTGYRMRMHQVELQRLELESQVRERTEEINRRKKEIEALYQADENLHRHLDLDNVLQALVDTAIDILNADKGSLLCWDENKANLLIRASRNFHPETIENTRIPRGSGVVGQVAETGETITVEDASNDPRVTLSITEVEGIRAFIQVSIKTGDEVFGVFSVDYAQPRKFSEDEKRLLLSLAQRAAIAIQNAQNYERAQELAASKERSRLAHELHDAVTQTLFSASLIAEALPRLWERDPEKGRQRLVKLRQMSRGALAEMRALLLELRPAALLETTLEYLLKQLGEAVMGRENISVDITVNGEAKLPTDVHIALYRIAQESLNNVVKHAHASKVDITLDYSFEEIGNLIGIELRICDDGCGIQTGDLSSERLGLHIMRERADSISAILNIDSKPDQGTCITVQWAADRSNHEP